MICFKVLFSKPLEFISLKESLIPVASDLTVKESGGDSNSISSISKVPQLSNFSFS